MRLATIPPAITRWDHFFLNMAFESAKQSKDPSTKVGAVIVAKNRFVISTGFNGFPMGFEDSHERWHDRDFKLDHVVHAEQNAISIAARMGHSTEGSTIYIAATDDSGQIWGGPPCVRCAVSCIAAGVTHYVAYPGKPNLLTKWGPSIAKAKAVILECGLSFRETPFPTKPFRTELDYP